MIVRSLNELIDGPRDVRGESFASRRFLIAELRVLEDEKLRARIDYCLQLLGQYSKAHIAIRESGLIDHKTWRNGM